MAFLSKLFGGKPSDQQLLDQQILEADSRCDCNRIAQLLDAGANINIRSDNGGTMLIHALHRRDVEMTRLLIDRGADVELATNDGVTPLANAALVEFTEGVRLLLNAGANPERKVGEYAPIDVARSKNYAEIYEMLQANYSLDQKVIEAAKKWDRDRIIKLLDAGANVNAHCTAGQSLLLRALNMSDVEMTKLLIERGADVEQAANDGMTPLVLAVTKEFTYGVRLLMIAGADPERLAGGAKNSRTALWFAEKGGHAEIYSILMANVANRKNPFEQKLDDEDPMLVQAQAAALQDLPQFIKMFNERDKTPGYVFSVKVPLADENGREHLWLMVYEINDQFILGTIGNDPTVIKNFKYGDAIQSPYESVEDIIVTDGGTKFVMGGHTFRAMIDRDNSRKHQ